MWNIKDLKERGKICHKKNAWRAILVALVITIIGGMPGSNAVSQLVGFSFNIATTIMDLGDDDDIDWEESGNDNTYNDDYDEEFEREFEKGLEEGLGNDYNYYEDNKEDIWAGIAIVLVILLIIACIVMMVIGVISLLLKFFLLNPLFVGTQRFFVHNLSGMGQIGDLGFGFDRHYKNNVSVMFFRDLYTFAWTLVFFFPGIYKSYEYRMIPYLMAEYPDMSKDRAFFTSKYMMQGNKWRAFLFDLSFIGWWILNVFTLGLLGIFYVNPYYAASAAAMYEAIKASKGIPEYRDPRMMYDPNTGNPVANPPMPTPVYRPSTPNQMAGGMQGQGGANMPSSPYPTPVQGYAVVPQTQQEPRTIDNSNEILPSEPVDTASSQDANIITAEENAQADANLNTVEENVKSEANLDIAEENVQADAKLNTVVENTQQDENLNTSEENVQS